MRISELIDELHKFKEKYGDLPVLTPSLPGEDSSESLVPLHGLVATFESGGNSESPEEVVLCSEEFYYYLHAEDTEI